MRLGEENRLFTAHVAEWMASPEYVGRYVVIKGSEVVGFYTTLDKAFAAGTERFGLDDFLIQRISPPPETHVTFLGASVRRV